MQHITDFLNVSSLDIAKDKKEKLESLDPLACDLVTNIFMTMYAACPGFDTFYADKQKLKLAKHNWCIYFTENKINTRQQVQLGLKKLIATTYPNPPMLHEFMEWCKPSPMDFGLPDIETAYRISIRMNIQFSEYKPTCQKTFEVIKHAINQIGTTKYRQMKESDARKIFEYYYSFACKQFLEGALKPITEAIEDNSSITQEQLKQNQVINDAYRDVKSSDSAMNAIKGLLG